MLHQKIKASPGRKPSKESLLGRKVWGQERSDDDVLQAELPGEEASREGPPGKEVPREGPPGRKVPLGEAPGEQVSGMGLSLAVHTHQKVCGLLFREPNDEVLMIAPCSDVHTVGMKHRLDIAFVDKSGKVLEVKRDVGPCRRLRNRGAHAVLERFSSCSTPWFVVGDQVGITTLRSEEL